MPSGSAAVPGSQKSPPQPLHAPLQLYILIVLTLQYLLLPYLTSPGFSLSEGPANVSIYLRSSESSLLPYDELRPNQAKGGVGEKSAGILAQCL